MPLALRELCLLHVPFVLFFTIQCIKCHVIMRLDYLYSEAKGGKD